jgi:aryl-alcohol dehydrogenase-like predicted oxidoreductase
MARALDLGVTAWSVLGAGVLTGKYNRAETAQGRAARWDAIPEKQKALAETVMAVAQSIGCTPSQVALSWARQQPGVLIPLLGATKAAQLSDNLGCLNVTLGEDHRARLNEASQIELGFPHDFLAGGEVQELVYGGTRAQLDNHHEGHNWNG